LSDANKDAGVQAVIVVEMLKEWAIGNRQQAMGN